MFLLEPHLQAITFLILRNLSKEIQQILKKSLSFFRFFWTPVLAELSYKFD